MRSFLSGGIASAEDITQGLPRVEELFESRRPKSMAIMSEISGVVSQDDTKKNVVIKVTGHDETGAEVVKSYSIPFTQHARVMPGDRVEKGDIITREGVLYPQDILAIKGLEDVQNELATSLPYGKQRRLEIARALATDPTLLLLDEPAAGMNPQETLELAEFIKEIRDHFHKTILLIEHHMDLVMGIADRIYVLDFGKLIAKGTPEEIQNNERVIDAYLGVAEDAED